MPDEESWQDPYGTPVESFGSSTRWGVYRYTLGVLWRLWRRRRSYRLVYFLMPGLQVALGVPLAAWLKKIIVMKFSGSNEVRKLLASPLGRWELSALARYAHRILLLNDGMFAEAAEAKLPVEKLEWMPNPVDIRSFAPLPATQRSALREEFGIAPGDFTILFVGRLAPEKMLPVLLNGFASFAQQQPQARLILVGDGPERPSLEKLAASLHISHAVQFTGRTDPAVVHRWLQCADAFALLSKLEGFPVALLEAMAVGLPSVVSDIPANVQLITHGDRGLTVPVGDETAVAAAFAHLQGKPAQAAAWGATARQYVETRFSLESIAKRYENLFDAGGIPSA